MNTSYFEVLDGDSGDMMDMVRIVMVKSERMNGTSNHGVKETGWGIKSNKEDTMKEFGWVPGGNEVE